MRAKSCTGSVHGYQWPKRDWPIMKPATVAPMPAATAMVKLLQRIETQSWIAAMRMPAATMPRQSRSSHHQGGQPASPASGFVCMSTQPPIAIRTAKTSAAPTSSARSAVHFAR